MKFVSIGRIMINLDKVVEFSPAMEGDSCVFIRFEGDENSTRFDYPYSQFKKLVNNSESVTKRKLRVDEE